LNQEKTKLEENLANLRKKMQAQNLNQNETQISKNDNEIYRNLEKKDRNILELKAKLELKEK
jgi:hypothetical protein